MATDPILDAISAGGTSAAVADDPILSAIQSRSSAPSATEGDPILAAIAGKTAKPTGKIATPDMVGQWAHDNDSTIAEAHHHFQNLGYVLGDYEDAGVPRPQVAPAVAPGPGPRIINLDLDRTPEQKIANIRPNALLNAPPFEPPTVSEMIGNAIPDAAAPVLAGAKKYLVDPFERMAAKGAEFGRDVAQAPIEEFTGLQHLPEMVEQAKAAKYGPIPAGETLEEQASREHPIAMGVTGAVGSTVGGVAADPRNWPFLASSAARPLLQRLVSGGFGVMMSKDAIQRAKQLSQQWDTLSPEQRTEQITSLGINTLFAGASAAHALSPTGSIGAGEQLHPETPETLQAQTDALENGTNKAVYFPKGQQNIPAAPDGATVTVVKGNKPGAGTWYHDESITPDEIHDAVADGTYHQLLGFTQSKEEATANGQPTTVVARDGKGVELKAGLADGTDPNAIAAQSAVLARQFPEAKIGVETPEQVIRARQASTPAPETSEVGAPLSEQTQPVEPPHPEFETSPPGSPAHKQIVAWANRAADGDEVALAALRKIAVNKIDAQDARFAAQKLAEVQPRVAQGVSPTGVERRTQARQDYQAAIESTPPGQPTPGEKLSQEIRAARAGAPAGITEGEALQRIMLDPERYAKYQEADQKGRDRMLVQAKNEMVGTLNFRPSSHEQILQAMDMSDLGQRAADIEARHNRGEQIPVKEIDDLHALMDKIQGSNGEVRESAANQRSAQAGEETASETAQSGNRTAERAEAGSTEPALSEAAKNPEAVLRPSVGDRVQVGAGPLKGKTLEVTKAGETGVYGRMEEGGPIKFVKHGDFEAKPSLVGETAYSNPLFDPEVWKSTLGYLKPTEAAGQADLRARTGELARKQAVLQERMKAEHARWRGRSDADMLAFADRVENGEADRQARGVTLNPKTQALLDKGKKSLTTQDKNLATTLRTLLDEGRTSVQNLGTGKLDSWIEHYFPHIWSQKGKVGEAIGRLLGKRPLEGPKSFLKQRTIPTTAEGFDAGLKPVTTNPVDLALLKMHEMNRYVMAHRLLGDLKDAGTAKFVRFGDRAPEGWKPLDDKVFQVLQYSEVEKGPILRGRYYAPEAVATPINRYVASGLKGIPLYDMVRGFGNTLNQLQLGLSGFHLGTTSLNSVISQFALGAKQAARGEILKGAKNILTAPAAPIRNLIQGGRVAGDYLRPDQAKQYAATAKAVETAGGRVGMGEEYTNNAIERMMQSFANKKYLKGALQSIPAAIEAQAIPVLKWTVPRMKLGAFHDLASDIFARAQKNNWSQDRVRSELQKSWDSIDNRFGQVVYDNLNWNKVAKDLAFIGVRSVGWNYGTWRELGGGVKDLATQVGQALNKKGFDVTDRMAYTFALPVTIAALGGMYQLAHTGKWPQTAKDYFYPKNGHVEDDGTEARSSLPSYMKDVFAVSQHPVDTALHKVNPAVGLMTEMLENKDYYGNEIRNTDDPAMAQLWQAVGHVGKSFLPFTLRNAQKRSQIGQKGPESQVENFLGITPAPRSVEQSDAEALAHEMIQRRAPAGAHTTAEQKRQQRIFDLENQVRSGTLTRDALKQKLDSGEVTEQDARTAITRARTSGLARAFKQLSIPESLKVWDVANDKERAELQPLIETKVENSFEKLTREDQDIYRPLLRDALTWQPKKTSKPPTATSGIPFIPPTGTGVSIHQSSQ